MTLLIAAALLIAGTEANFDASTSPSGSGHAHLTTPGGAYFGSVKIGPAVLGVRGAVDQVKLIAEPGRTWGALVRTTATAVARIRVPAPDSIDLALRLAATLSEARYRPEILREAAIGLTLLGDRELMPNLLTTLSEAHGSGSLRPIAGKRLEKTVIAAATARAVVTPRWALTLDAGLRTRGAHWVETASLFGTVQALGLY